MRYGLIGYTEDLDRYYDYKGGRASFGAKPRFAISDSMRSFIQRIETCDCSGFSGVGVRLLMYDFEHQQVVEKQVARIINDCLLDGSEHNVSLACSGSFGVSVIATRSSSPIIWNRLRDLGKLKQYETKCQTWDLILIRVKNGDQYDIELKVLYGIPNQSSDMDDKLQALRDKRFNDQMKNGSIAGRNDPCPCGSGKKFKKCHGQV